MLLCVGEFFLSGFMSFNANISMATHSTGHAVSCDVILLDYSENADCYHFVRVKIVIILILFNVFLLELCGELLAVLALPRFPVPQVFPGLPDSPAFLNLNLSKIHSSCVCVFISVSMRCTWFVL